MAVCHPRTIGDDRHHPTTPDLYAPMAASSPHATIDTPLDKDTPLRDDIRLLGRLLGDTLRQQEGQALYELVEQVRRTAIQFARHNHPEARAGMAALLDPLPQAQAQHWLSASAEAFAASQRARTLPVICVSTL